MGIVVTARALTRKGTSLRARAQGIVGGAGRLLERSAQDVVEEAKKYPGIAPPYVDSKGHTHQQRPRTYRLQDGWQRSSVQDSGGALLVQIENHATDIRRRTPKEYAEFVQGNRQRWYHKAHGWSNIADIRRKHAHELALRIRALLAGG